MKISACLITRNEEKNIARSILSYKDIVDEIIVVDSESTDDTVKIAASLGAQVYTRPWTNDFAAAKNDAIDRATGDWILFLDADEYFGEGQSAAVIQTIKEAQKEGHEDIYSPRHEMQENSDQVFAIVLVNRIIKNHVGIRYVNKIHEQLVKSDGSSIQSTVSRAFTIYHTGYDPSLVEGKLQRNLLLLQEEGSMQDEFYRFYFLAECYFESKQYEACLRQIKHVLAFADFDERVYRSFKVFRVYVFQIASMLALRHQYSENEIQSCITRAVHDFGKHPEIRWQEACFYSMYGRIEDAVFALGEAVKMHRGYDDFFENNFMSRITQKYNILVGLYCMKGDWQNARRWAAEAFREDKENNDLLFGVFVLLRDMETEDKRREIGKLFETKDAVDPVRLAEAAWLSGNSDLYTLYLLDLLKRVPELAMEHGIRCRIYFLQKNYGSILEMADGRAGGPSDGAAALAAAFAAGKKIEGECMEDVRAALCELLRAGEGARAEVLARDGLKEKVAAMDSTEKKGAFAKLFEEFGRWACGAALYREAAYAEEKERAKWGWYLGAARLLYLSGDDPGLLGILREAQPLTPPGNHLPAELLEWTCKRTKKRDRQVYQEARRLQAKYEARYRDTCDSPLPLMEEADA